MNPLILGIVALGGLMLLTRGPDTAIDTGRYSQVPRSYAGSRFIVSGITGTVPYAGFRGGGVSGTVSEEYLPQLGVY